MGVHYRCEHSCRRYNTGCYNLILTVNIQLTFLILTLYSSLHFGIYRKKVPVSGKTVIDISMVPDITTLGDVVVIGYGVQRKSDLTGSVGSVKAETLLDRPAATVSQALAGRVTGVNVSINSGRPEENQISGSEVIHQ